MGGVRGKPLLWPSGFEALQLLTGRESTSQHKEGSMESSRSQNIGVEGSTRRQFLALATLASALSACISFVQRFRFPKRKEIYKKLGNAEPDVCDVVVIGSGFGGTISALTLAR